MHTEAAPMLRMRGGEGPRITTSKPKLRKRQEPIPRGIPREESISLSAPHKCFCPCCFLCSIEFENLICMYPCCSVPCRRRDDVNPKCLERRITAFFSIAILPSLVWAIAVQVYLSLFCVFCADCFWVKDAQDVRTRTCIIRMRCALCHDIFRYAKSMEAWALFL
jgi:hypothetical protein